MTAPTTTPLPSPLAALVGVFRGTRDLFAELGGHLVFYVRVLSRVGTDIIVRQRYRGEVARHVSNVAVGSGAWIFGAGMVFVVFTMSFFTGTEVGLQGYKGLEQIGAEAFTGLVGSFANVREVTPLIAATALAAQVGAGFTAEIGAMRISDEIDALEVMAVPPLVYVVATRVTATLIALIPIYLISLLASFWATKLVTTEFYGLSPGVYDYYFRLYLPPIDIVYSVLKMIVFTIVVTLIHCYYGYYASGGPAGVGVAVGRAIRASIVTIVVINFVLSLLFWGDGSTVTLTG
ncbi:MAG: ABC transporter permease [Acidimicrobiales bacterium]|nr:ABC transporter permease [Acidimicrobiales bacterium]